MVAAFKMHANDILYTLHRYSVLCSLVISEIGLGSFHYRILCIFEDSVSFLQKFYQNPEIKV